MESLTSQMSSFGMRMASSPSVPPLPPTRPLLDVSFACLAVESPPTPSASTPPSLRASRLPIPSRQLTRGISSPPSILQVSRQINTQSAQVVVFSTATCNLLPLASSPTRHPNPSGGAFFPATFLSSTRSQYGAATTMPCPPVTFSTTFIPP